MNNAEKIVSALDALLDHEVSLVVFGRAAIALGYPDPPKAAIRSLDVDVILRHSQTATLDADEQFWKSLELMNQQLDAEGLYLTHAFEEDQVFLRNQWESEITPILRPSLRHLRLFRPATIDLILTKMMRGADFEDMRDVDFLIRNDRVSSEQISAAIRDAKIPDDPEFKVSFELAQPVVIALAAKAAAEGFVISQA